MLRYLLFDIDDTVLNFRDHAEVALHRALADEGLTFTAEQLAVYRRINNELWEQVSAGAMARTALYAVRFQRALDALGIAGDGAAIERHFRRHLCDVAVPEEGAEDTLRALSGRYVLATASNAPQRQQELRLERSGLARYFTHVLTSERLGVDKPHPAFFQACLRVLGDPSPQEVLMIGDSLTADAQGALRAGLRACWLNRAAASTASLPTGDEPLPDAVPQIRTLPELLDVLA